MSSTVSACMSSPVGGAYVAPFALIVSVAAFVHELGISSPADCSARRPRSFRSVSGPSFSASPTGAARAGGSRRSRSAAMCASPAINFS